MPHHLSTIQRDFKHIWHPCTRMKDFETHAALEVFSATGDHLITNHGKIIDAIASWWCKPLGHRHPKIIAAIQSQLEQFEHIIGAGTTHNKIALLGEKLAQVCGLEHVFFASDGASAVEIALKMAIQSQQILGHGQRKRFACLKNGYHGETLGALSVSDVGLFKTPYQSLCFQPLIIPHIPYINTIDDPLWKNAELYWQKTLNFLEPHQQEIAAIIIEPLIQGAGGMQCYSADYLNRLALWAKKQGILLIADEIMTGLGRTGSWLACQQAKVEADLVCLSKGLTAGAIPMSCVMVSEKIYQLFYPAVTPEHSFLHSHTFSGNALGVSAALATLAILEEEHLCQRAQFLGEKMRDYFQTIAKQTHRLQNIRGIGAIIAADIIGDDYTAKQVQYHALKNGALLRPMGNTLYWLPPLNIQENTLEELAQITINALTAIQD